MKEGGRYRMDDGHVVIDSIAPIRLGDITDSLAQESGFEHVADLLETAQHGRGTSVYLIRFHYLAPGAWDVTRAAGDQKKKRPASDSQSEVLRRIRKLKSRS